MNGTLPESGGSRICPICGQPGLETTRDPIEFDYRDGTWWIEPDFDYDRCRACDEEIYPSRGLEHLELKAAALARAELGLLSPDEIRAIRIRLGLTQGDLERALGVSRGSVGRWERGPVFPSVTADKLLRILDEHPELLQSTALDYVAREGRGPYRTRG
jgi:putative zinc finger/helix-turn-helix YgiT family protein